MQPQSGAHTSSCCRLPLPSAPRQSIAAVIPVVHKDIVFEYESTVGIARKRNSRSSLLKWDWDFAPLRLKETAPKSTANVAGPAVAKNWEIILTKAAPVGQAMVVTAESQLTGQRQSFTVVVNAPAAETEAPFVWPVLEMAAFAVVLALLIALFARLAAPPPPAPVAAAPPPRATAAPATPSRPLAAIPSFGKTQIRSLEHNLSSPFQPTPQRAHMARPVVLSSGPVRRLRTTAD